MKGQVRGQGRQTTNQFFWWPSSRPLYYTPLHGKTPLLHYWHQKKVPISQYLSHELNLYAIEKNYSQDPPLSIHLKAALCLRALSVCNIEQDSEILVCAAPVYTKPKMEVRGVAGKVLVWRKGSWCGSTTTLPLPQYLRPYCGLVMRER